MSYSTYEESVQDGDPSYRILITQGSTEYRYTTEPYIVNDNQSPSNTWLPSPIDTSDILQTNEMAKDALKLEFPRDNAVAVTFLGGVPEQITTVKIWRGHAGDVTEEFLVAWAGRVSGVSLDADKVTLDCENIFTSMRRPGLRRRYQTACPFALYGAGCGVSKAAHLITGTATAYSGSTVTVTISPQPADGFLTGGMLETTDGVFRFIEKEESGVITLSRPITTLNDDIDVGPTSVNLYPGCNKSMSTCDTKFSNLVNYGGFPWIPRKNPFNSAITGGVA